MDDANRCRSHAGDGPGASGGGRATAKVALPVLPGTPTARIVARSKNGPRRAAVLVGVHLLFAAHVAHWWWTGSTLSPVEPSESMQTLELGLVNAGFVFFGAAILSTLIFGRFFCGWGCHIVALQDLCGWLMKKCGVHPRPFRSRVLAFAPIALALYMFVWPTLKRVLLVPALDSWWPDAGRALGAVPFPEDGFRAHFITEAFWSTFPGPLIAVPFLLICGFATVYFLGAKGFCTYGCPYGGVFGPVDRLAPGRIVADLDRCHQCGHCTAVCTSNVRVHEEIQVYSSVVDPGCMKCMDCVSVCPNQALSFGFARPGAIARATGEKPRRKLDTSIAEDLLLGAAFLGAFLCWRGAYDAVPMLMAVGIGACLTFLAWKLWRFVHDRDVRLGPVQVKRGGRISTAGWAVLAAITILWALTLHTGAVQIVRARADDAYETLALSKAALLEPAAPALEGDQAALASRGLEAYRASSAWTGGGWALAGTDSGDLRAALLELGLGQAERAETLLRRVIERSGPSDELIADLGRLMSRRGDAAGAQRLYDESLRDHPEFWAVREQASLDALRSGGVGRIQAALTEAEAALAQLPPERFTKLTHARTRLTIARLKGAMGDPTAALAHLTEAVRVAPNEPVLRENLAAAMVQIKGDLPGAIEQMQAAVARAPRDLELRTRLGALELQAGRNADALATFTEVRRRDAANAQRSAAIGAILRAAGLHDEAARWESGADSPQSSP